MALLTPPPAAPQRGDRTTFANRVDAFITWLINFVTELISVVVNLNSVAAGGAYATPFTFTDAGSVIGGGGGAVAVNDYTSQSTVTSLYCSATDSAGALVKLGLDDIFYVGATSAVKGYIKLTKLGDPSKWLRLRVTSYAWAGTYGQFSVVVAGFSSANPFTPGDVVIMDCQRTGDKGDKGDTGPAGYTPTYMYVRDERAQGTGGGTLGTGPATRVLNTVKVNTISGASLASNQVTLPAGTYEYVGSVPYAYGGAGYTHKAQLYNVTDAVVVDNGTSSSNADGSSNGYTTLSMLRGTFTISATKTFSIKHFYTASGGTDAAGRATNLGGVEVYTEILFRKIA